MRLQAAGSLIVIPVAAFEIVFLPAWLLSKGFNIPQTIEAMTSLGK
jgi:hypothetical protein